MRGFELALLALLAATLPFTSSSADDHAIFVDGGYAPGEDDDHPVDDLIERRLRQAQQIFDRDHPGGSSATVDSRDELKRRLEGIRCGCGDTVTVMLMGHGVEDGFRFVQARGSERRLKAETLAEWLEGAAVECCCKIHVVIFSCHSGSFLDELFEQPHVESVWASSRAGERSYTALFYEPDGRGGFRPVDDGDWMQGFLDDWDAARGAVGDALEASSRSAEEKMPEKFVDRQHPTGWRRGEGSVLAHVEGGTARRPRLHYYEPEFLRSTTERLDLSQVERPDERLRRCDWVRFPARFGKPGETTASGAVERADPPRERVLAHVETLPGRHRGKVAVGVHTVRPKWQFCEKQRLTLEEREQWPDEGLPVCSWLDVDVSVLDPEKSLHTDRPLTPANPVVRVKAHVSGSVDPRDGTFRAHLLEPSFLHCKNVVIRLPAAERTKLGELRPCRNVVLDLALRPIDDRGTLAGRDLHEFLRVVGAWDAEVDLAVHPPSPTGTSLGVHDEQRTLSPAVTVTNVGAGPAGGTVRAALVAADDGELLAAWLAGEPASPLWNGSAELAEVAAAGTTRVELGSWLPPAEGGRFRVGYRVESVGDANPGNDTAVSLFEVPAALPADEPAGDAYDEADGEPFDGLDLGLLAPGRYPMPVTARNASCPGRHDFQVRFLPGGDDQPAWIEVPPRDVLEDVRPGRHKTLQVSVDLTGAEAGRRLTGTLRIECLTCPATCSQDVEEVAVRVTVGGAGSHRK